MPVIDFLRRTELTKRPNGRGFDHYIVIPPYHTGHLGFIPDTKLSLNLHLFSPFETSRAGCELVATPFDRPIGSMFRLMCLLDDEPGVVSRLLRTLSNLHINVVKQDSSVMNAHQRHFVELIGDWSRHEEKTGRQMTRRREARSSHVYRYRYMQERIPISDERYVRLYEEIMIHCGDAIVLDRAYGRALPSIHIRPFTYRTSENAEGGVLERRAKEKPLGRRAFLKLSKKHLDAITAQTDFRPDERLPYLVTSQGEARTLRVLFPTRAQHKRMLTVAFDHKDEVGAITACTTVLGTLGFNIVASLLRKRDQQRSTWEAVLEAPADWGDLSNEKTAVQRLATGLNSRTDYLAPLAPYDVSISAPLYPKPLKPRPSYPIRPTASSPTPSATDTREERVPSETLASTIDRARAKDARVDPGSSRVGFLRDVQEGLEHPKPRIFLSYPRSARRHADILKSREDLNREFEFDEYQEQDSRDVVRQALHLINRCDFFIAIWHAELAAGSNEYTVSPWMPFEYGAALAAGKRCILAHSEHLPPSISLRITPGIAHLRYSELTFEGKTVPAIVQLCIDAWADPKQTHTERPSQPT